MNRQLQANGGIMQVAPREKFGLGSKLKRFVRKIIPNELSEIAVKAAPFVAPFNPQIAAAMAGIGSFDQTGRIGDSLKSAGKTYAGGQLARYAGGAGFQDPSMAAFTPSGFTAGFSSPVGSETGLGKFFSNRGTDAVQGVNETITPTNLNDYAGTTTEIIPTNLNDYAGTATEIIPTNLNDYANTATEALVDASDMTLVGDVKQAASQEFNLFKAAADKAKNFDYRGAGNKALELGKKFGKAIFTKPNPIPGGKPLIDKAAVMGAVAFAGSYAEAKALAADAGVEITSEEYDEASKAEKKEEYATYLTNFFGGQKDGGRIGYEGGANEYITRRERKNPMAGLGLGGLDPTIDESDQKMIVIMTENGPQMVTESEFNEQMDIDKQPIVIDMQDFLKDKNIFKDMKKDGGRIGLKFGTKPEEAEVGIMTVDVEAGDDEEEENDLMAGITFSSAEKSYLFRKLGGAGGSDRSFTMPQLYRVLSNPDRYAADAAVLKEIAIMGLGKKDGGRIGYKGGANRVSELLILRDQLVGKGEDVSDIEAEIFQLTGKTFKSVGGISDVPTGKIRKNNAGVTERDYRDEGGFVPVGIKERADDVPAMLSKNEFVMTADAVRGIGNGSVEEGSKKLYNTMKKAEQVGKA